MDFGRTFRIQVVISWLSGTLLLRNPFDITHVGSWVTWASTFYVLVNIIQLALHGLDYFYLSLSVRVKYQDFETYVSAGIVGVTIIFVAFIRLHLILKAKKIAIFFTKISHYFQMPSSIFDFQEGAIQITKFKQAIIWMELFLRILEGSTSTLSNAITQSSETQNSTNSFSSFPLQFAFFLFGELPYEITAHVAFVLVLLSSKYIMDVFELFCSQFEMEISKIGKKRKGDMRELFMRTELNFQPSSKAAKHTLIQRFSKMHEILCLFDEINGPILLGLFPLMCITLVQVMDRLIIHKLPPLILTHELMTVAFCTLHLYLLQVGHEMNRLITERKIRIEHMLHRAPKSILREDLHRVRDIFTYWKWNLSACSYFDIDRSLIAGIISLLLAYTVVLIQLQRPT